MISMVMHVVHFIIVREMGKKLGNSLENKFNEAWHSDQIQFS